MPYCGIRRCLRPLIEVAFISNREEEGLMYADWFWQAAAPGIVEGLERYFAQI
ncbi:hypothetical protein [Thermodesulfitimonas sp.]